MDLIYSFVSAYNLVGGYECIIFYYTCLIDCTAHGGKPKAVATRYASIMNTGQAPCSFDQIVELTAAKTDEKPKPDLVSYKRITGKPFSATDLPDLESTAKLLNEVGSIGRASPFRLREGMKQRTSWAEVLEFMGNESFHFLDRDEVPDKLKNAAFDALEEEYGSRREATYIFRLPKISRRVQELTCPRRST